MTFNRWLSPSASSQKPPLANLFTLGASLTCFFTWVTLLPLAAFWLELASHFRWQYWLASGILFAATWIYRQPLLRILLAVAFVINSFFIIPWYFNAQTSSATGANPQDLAQHSVKLLQLNALSSNRQFQAFKNLLEAEQPDVILLQEVDSVWATQLRQLNSDYPYHLIIPRHDNFGIALLSRLPDLSIEQTHWGPSGVPSILATIKIGRQAVQIAVTHPLPPVNKSYATQRDLQLAEIARWASASEQPLILAGDFNLTMWSPAYTRFSQLPLTNTRKGFGILATWPARLSFFGIPIDHILVSQEFQVNNTYTGPKVGSDHLPLITQLTLKSR